MKGFAIVVCILCVVGLCFNCCTTFNDHTYELKITEKERIHSSEGGYYLIYGFDESGQSRVFANADTLLRGKFDSSRAYAELEEGKYYEITVVGCRIPLFSTYENIIDYKEIDGWEVNKNEN